MDGRKTLALVGFLAAAQLVGLAGSVFTAPAIPGWYATLEKPAFTPPNWAFAPVWTSLFVLMGIAAYLAWEKRGRGVLRIFWIQLALNVLWSAIFFGMRNPGLAFAELAVLWVAIAANVMVFYRASRRAGMLLIPYLAWVTVAGWLNYSVWILN